MSEKYKEYCMKFSNEEIRAYMVDYLISNSMDNKLINAIQLSIISVVFCHREPLFFMPKNFKNITKNS